jgi:hypothetical protein
MSSSGTRAAGHRRLAASAPKKSKARRRLGHLALLGIWALSSVIASTTLFNIQVVPSWAWRPAAAVLLLVYLALLTVRAGGRWWVWTALGVVVAAGGLSGVGMFVVMAASLTGIAISVSAFMFTRPAETFSSTLREFAIAVLISINGTIAVAAWNAPVNVSIFLSVVTVGAGLVGVLIIWSLGAGLHGLSRQYQWILAGVAGVALSLVIYGGVLRTYGSPALMGWIDVAINWMRLNIGGVPRPFEALVGFPAIILGTSMRSRYREGWWITTFAVLATSGLVTSLVDSGAYPSYVARSAAYSIAIGVVVGFIGRRLVLRPHSARAARPVIPPHRTEPGRFAPLR